MSRKWLTILNFIRYDSHSDNPDYLFETTVKQFCKINQYHYPATWLMQVDAMLLGKYVDFFKQNLPDNHELGVWFEITRAHCDVAGVTYNGPDGYNWHHHANACLSIGYSVADRIKLADAAMTAFYDSFGYYPKSVAAWYIDAVTLDYLADKYHVSASANCREQWGLDGYSLWGGYFAGAYYPSRQNALLPAGSEQHQINLPVFRLLGSCPIYQYGADIQDDFSSIYTMETISKPGQSPEFIDAFFENTYHNSMMPYAFAQIGQENSFGWEKMKNGFELQMEKVQELVEKYCIEIATLGDVGEWYKEHYQTTAPNMIVALKDYQNSNKKSFWFQGKKYRINLVLKNSELMIRDLHLFADDYKEPNLTAPCTTGAMIVDSLPVVNQGHKHNYIEYEDDAQGWEPFTVSDYTVVASNDEQLEIVFTGDWPLTISLTESEIRLSAKNRIRFRVSAAVDNQRGVLQMSHQGYQYSLTLNRGEMVCHDEVSYCYSLNNSLEVAL